MVGEDPNERFFKSKEAPLSKNGLGEVTGKLVALQLADPPGFSPPGEEPWLKVMTGPPSQSNEQFDRFLIVQEQQTCMFGEMVSPFLLF